jgi:glycosyltransferase involved in cell wall biosynthesis
MPLSVLEALASDIPVASTRFGVLPDLFEGAAGIRFADSDEGLVRAVEELLERPAPTRHLVEAFSWDAAIGDILGHMESHDAIASGVETFSGA